MKFYKQCRYRHLCAKDLDIEVVRIQYVDDKRAKLVIRYLHQRTGDVLWIGLDGLERITIKADEFQYWNKVGSGK